MALEDEARTAVENAPDYYDHGLAFVREFGLLADGDDEVLEARWLDDPPASFGEPD